MKQKKITAEEELRSQQLSYALARHLTVQEELLFLDSHRMYGWSSGTIRVAKFISIGAMIFLLLSLVWGPAIKVRAPAGLGMLLMLIYVRMMYPVLDRSVKKLQALSTAAMRRAGFKPFCIETGKAIEE